MKYMYIDFEYNNSSEALLNLVCVSLSFSDEDKIYRYWLHQERERKEYRQFAKLENEEFRKLILQAQDLGYVFVSWAVEAEARSFMSAGLDPTEFEWIDLMVVYKMMVNHNNKLAYGKQLVKGIVVNSFPPVPKYMLTEEEKQGRGNSHKTPTNLAAACFKLLGVKINTGHKTTMRDLIISDPDRFSDGDRDDIQNYCDSDIIYLPQILDELIKWQKKLLGKEFKGEQVLEEWLRLSAFSAHNALDVSWGYPVDVEFLTNLEKQYKVIMWNVASKINKLFPDVAPFTLKKDGKTSMSVKTIREWVNKERLDHNWLKTKPSDRYPNGQLSISMDGFAPHFPYRHEYPESCFGAQMIRYFKYKQNLSGFVRNEESDKKTFWDYVGKDGRCRPYVNPYGSQSSRNQPSSTSFIPLKPAWMRSAITPPRGSAICVGDWTSEEFLISALESKDKKMVLAYESGDVYIYFAKEAKAVPKDGTKHTHPEERDLFKPVTLAMSYMMTKHGLAPKLTKDLGKEVNEDEAAEFIDMFNDCFPDFYIYKEWAIEEYNLKGRVKLPDGWYMWGDNSNFRSVVNSKIQGIGGVVMRESVKLCHGFNLKIPYTLHDAIAIEIPSYEFDKVDQLNSSMKEGFKWAFKDDPWKFKRANAGIDFRIWSLDYPEEDGYITTPSGIKVKSSQRYIDGRAIKEYEYFKKYIKLPKYLKVL